MSTERDELAELLQVEMHRTDEITRWTLQAPVDLADALLAAGYRKQPAKVKGNSPRGLIRELLKHLDHWEKQDHRTVGIDYLRRHFKDAA